MQPSQEVRVNFGALSGIDITGGLPFDEQPAFAPIDESYPDRPNWSYALAKQLCETLAEGQ
jgi:nucleoside-diphosphate-sugar epimerase